MGVLSVILLLMGPGPWRLTPGWPPPGGRNPKPGGRGPGNGEPRPPRLGGNPRFRGVKEIFTILSINSSVSTPAFIVAFSADPNIVLWIVETYTKLG